MSWDLISFGDLYATPSRNGLSLPASQRGHGCKMINMGELFAYPRIMNPEMARVQPSENEISRYAVEKDDLLFARRSLVLEGAGKCAIVAEHEYPTVFESSIIRVRLNKELCDPVFYFYFFRSQAGFGFIQQIVNQVAVSGIRGSDLERMKIIYPPLPAQQKIAAILSAYDDLIENNNKRIALLEKAAEEIYREWFVRMTFAGWEKVKFVKGVPEGWGKAKLGQLCKIKGGKRLPMGHNLTDIETEHPYIKARNIKNGKIDMSDLEYVEDRTFDQIRNYIARKDNICITIVANIGDVGIVPASLDGASLTENAVKLTNLQSNINNLYLLYTLSTKFYKDYMNILSAGAAQSKLGIYKIETIELLLPPIDLQKKFDETVSPLRSKVEILNSSNKFLQASRDLLLSRLISGKLSVEGLDVRGVPSPQL
jgi:type I restriction enzyme S subunit